MKKKIKIDKQGDTARLFDFLHDDPATYLKLRDIVTLLVDDGRLPQLKMLQQIFAKRNPQDLMALKSLIEEAEQALQNESGGLASSPISANTVAVSFTDMNSIREYPAQFKEALSKLIIQRFDSYKNFAEEIGIPESSISRLFTTEIIPRLDTLTKFQQALAPVTTVIVELGE